MEKRYDLFVLHGKRDSRGLGLWLSVVGFRIRYSAYLRFLFSR